MIAQSPKHSFPPQMLTERSLHARHGASGRERNSEQAPFLGLVPALTVPSVYKVSSLDSSCLGRKAAHPLPDHQASHGRMTAPPYPWPRRTRSHRADALGPRAKCLLSLALKYILIKSRFLLMPGDPPRTKHTSCTRTSGKHFALFPGESFREGLL